MVRHTAKIALVIAGSALVLSGCGSSPAEKQMEAQAMKIEAEAELIVEQRNTYKEYKKCVKNSEGDEAKLRACDALLKLIDKAKMEAQAE